MYSAIVLESQTTLIVHPALAAEARRPLLELRLQLFLRPQMALIWAGLAAASARE